MAAVVVEGLHKSYGKVRRRLRRHLRGRSGRGVRAPRPQRRRQDDHRRDHWKASATATRDGSRCSASTPPTGRPAASSESDWASFCKSSPSSRSCRCAGSSNANAGYYPNPRPVDEVIDLVGLSEKADARVKSLSGGQQRRLDLGLGIIGNPDAALPRRAHHRVRPFRPAATHGTWSGPSPAEGRRSSSPRTTWTRPKRWPIVWRSSAGAASSPTGTPDSLGGRDVGEAHIRFRLPPGTTPPDLRVATSRRARRAVRDQDERRDRGAGRPHELGVRRRASTSSGSPWSASTLEDVYLRLTGYEARRAVGLSPGEHQP